MVRTGKNQNPSTFGAVGDESKVGTLYHTFERLNNIFSNLGGNADSFRPIFLLFGLEEFFYCPNSCKSGDT